MEDNSQKSPSSPQTTVDPRKTAASPQKTAARPQATATAPQKTAVRPQTTATAPEKTAVKPQTTAVSPEKTAVNPQSTATAPDFLMDSIEVPKGSHAPGDTIKVGGKSYTIEKCIGGGAEGEIYVVSDGSHRYALKLCHPGFYSNVKALDALKPLKGKGYIAEEVNFGDNFELMEYIPGCSAATAGIKGDAQAILAVAVKTAMALDAMHRAGVIHKDVKPANILIKDRDSWDSVLCDFGIADVLGEDGCCTTPQARTPIYAAPEVYNASTAIVLEGVTYCELTAKADFYSLGMTILSLWMGEGAFLSKEQEMAIAKNKGGIAIPADMPDPLAKICRGLLIKNSDKRWDLGEIERTLEGEDVPVDEEIIVEDLKITFNASKHQIANTPEELAELMVDDAELGTKYLYRGQVERWLAPYPELSMEIQEIVEKRYPTDKFTGFMATIYTLNPSSVFPLKGFSRTTGEAVSCHPVTLKEVSDFCNAAIVDNETASLLSGDCFKEWVRVRNRALAENLPSSSRGSDCYLLRVQSLDPLCDLDLRNDPSDPDYAMTQEGLGRLLNKVYNIFWNRFKGNVQTMREEWSNEEYAPFNHQIQYYTIANIVASFASPEDSHFLTDSLSLKGNRFEKQIGWIAYCTDRNNDDYKKKAGPKDVMFFAQATWMKVIAGFGITPEYEFVDTGKVVSSRDELFSHKTEELEIEYKERGLMGWLAVQHQENPHADLKPQFTYEGLLLDYLKDIAEIDADAPPVQRFADAQYDVSKLLSEGKGAIRSLSIRGILLNVFTVLFAIVPAVILLTMLVFSIIENPTLDTTGLHLEKFFWPLGLLLAAVIFFKDDWDIGCLLPIIIGAAGAALVFFLIKLLGPFILYIFAALLLFLLVFFSLKTVFFRSRYAKAARKFTKPGFEEKVLEPLYYAFDTEEFFDSSLNGTFDQEQIDGWKADHKRRRVMMLFFIGAVWVMAFFSLLIPKSERFQKFSTPLVQKIEKVLPEKKPDLLQFKSLEPGAKGDGVKALQQFLLDAGYTKNKPDGDYGPGTKKAVAAFQEANGLEPTGTADKKTITKINKLAHENLQALPQGE